MAEEWRGVPADTPSADLTLEGSCHYDPCTGEVYPKARATVENF